MNILEIGEILIGVWCLIGIANIICLIILIKGMRREMRANGKEL